MGRRALFLNVFLAVVLSLFLLLPVHGLFAQHTPDTRETVTIYFFGRDDCGFCQKQEEYLKEAFADSEEVEVEYLNVLLDNEAARKFKEVANKHGIPLVTPTTVIGPVVLQGFNTPGTTGKKIEEAIEIIKDSDTRTFEEHIESAPRQDGVTVGAFCDPDHGGVSCDIEAFDMASQVYTFDLPFVGVVDLKSFSLFTLSAVLGVVDGFNPCAMWVLVTFLILLSQIGDRRKMFLVAGLFILAEGVMYNLILNVWFTAWDFVALDAIVTPLVGLLALGGSIFFLYRYYKNRNQALTCDISDLESQSKTQAKITELVSSPISLGVILGVIVLAFSVNVIEFACSIGIPQAYTKILELNQLSFLDNQFYILIYTLGYMVDDVIVFALALWGFSKIQSHGHNYSQLSLLIGGILMLILGTLLIFNPSFLIL